MEVSKIPKSKSLGNKILEQLGRYHQTFSFPSNDQKDPPAGSATDGGNTSRLANGVRRQQHRARAQERKQPDR